MNSQSANYRSSLRDASRNCRGNLAEFGPALMLLFVTVLLPGVVIARFALATASISLLVFRCAEVASACTTYQSARDSVRATAKDLTHSSVWGLSGMGADAITNVDVFIDEQVLSTGQKNTYGPDRPMKMPISPFTNTYEYDVHITFMLAPIFQGCPLPLAPKVPLLNSPGTFTATAAGVVEYPDGLPCRSN